MMVLDHVGDQEAMVYAQLCQQPLVRTTETSLEPRRGTLSCLSARPPDLASWTGTRPRVVSVSPSIVPFVYLLQARGGGAIPRLAYRKANVLSPLQLHQPWSGTTPWLVGRDGTRYVRAVHVLVSGQKCICVVSLMLKNALSLSKYICAPVLNAARPA